MTRRRRRVLSLLALLFIGLTVAEAAADVKAEREITRRDTTQAVRVETVAGTGRKGDGREEGPATKTPCTDPFAVAFDARGRMYVAEAATHVVVRVSNGQLDRFAGTASPGDDDDNRLKATFREPYDLEFAASGNLYVIERLGHRVRRIDPDGDVTLNAGSHHAGRSPSGANLLEAAFQQPHDLCLTPGGSILICDTKNHRVCLIDPVEGQCRDVSLEASGALSAGDLAKLFRGPRVVVSFGDFVYLAFREGNTIWRFRLEGDTLTDGELLAGTGEKGYRGDGQDAVNASLGGPKGMDVDADGNVFIADTENHTVRRIDARTGLITTIVGDGERGDGPDGDKPLTCRLNRPHGITFGPDGHLYIADSLNHRVRRVVFE